MKTIFILNHSYELDACEETKFIGAYSSMALAQAAITRLGSKPGFREKPEAFHIEETVIDQDHWIDGFSTMTTIMAQRKDQSWTSVAAVCLPDKTYQIVELYDNDSLSTFRHDDIVECEDKDGELYAIRKIN